MHLWAAWLGFWSIIVKCVKRIRFQPPAINSKHICSHTHSFPPTLTHTHTRTCTHSHTYTLALTHNNGKRVVIVLFIESCFLLRQRSRLHRAGAGVGRAGAIKRLSRCCSKLLIYFVRTGLRSAETFFRTGIFQLFFRNEAEVGVKIRSRQKQLLFRQRLSWKSLQGQKKVE